MPRLAALTPLILASAISLVYCSSPIPTERSGPPSAHAATTFDRESGTATSASELRAEEKVAHLDSAEVTAFVANDQATLARLWSDQFVVTNPFNQFLDKRQVVGLVTSGTLAFSAYARQIEYIHAYGDVVVVAGRETVVWAGRIPLAGQTSQLRYTAVWARHGNEWREVARHASFVLPGGPGGPPAG